MEETAYWTSPHSHVPATSTSRLPKNLTEALWKIENASGQKLLMTVPPYLARSPKDLLLPRKVVEADRK